MIDSYIPTPLMDRQITETDTDALPVGSIAEMLAEPGVASGSVATQIRGWAQKKLLWSWLYDGNGRTRANYYTEDQWLIAKVLALLTEFGIADFETLNAAAVSLRGWNATDIDLTEEDIRANRTVERPARSPAQFIIDRFRRGDDWWMFELAVHRHSQSGVKVTRGRIRNARSEVGTQYGLPDDYIPRAMICIDLTPHLVRIFRDRTKGN